MRHTADMELTGEEMRVLGCLIEKERSTPDQYPLTTNALRTACNQKSNRDPVVDYGVATVEQTMLSLRDHGYARTVTGSGRTVKHKQVLDEALALSGGEVSIVGVLLLRGAQTPNELRVRTERLHGFESNDDVDATLNALANREVPLVTCIGKASGQREARWVHLLGDEKPAAPATPQPVGAASQPPATAQSVGAVPQSPAAAPPPSVVRSTGAPTAPSVAVDRESVSPGVLPDRVADLEAEVEGLRRDLDELRTRFEDLASQLGVV